MSGEEVLYTRHIRRLPISWEDSAPWPFTVHEVRDKLGDAYELEFEDGIARGYVAQQILRSSSATLARENVSISVPGRLFPLVFEGFGQVLPVMFGSVVSPSDCELLGRAIEDGHLDKGRFLPGEDIAWTMILDGARKPVAWASKELVLLWDLYLRIEQASRIWRAVGKAVGDVRNSEELVSQVKEVVDACGIAPMLEAYAAGVPIEDVLGIDGNRRR